MRSARCWQGAVRTTQNWRREHRGLGIYPENHLWDAAHGYLDLLTAVENRTDGSG